MSRLDVPCAAAGPTRHPREGPQRAWRTEPPQSPVSLVIHTPRLLWLGEWGVRGRGGPWEAKVGLGCRGAFRGSGQHRVGPRVPCCGVRLGFGEPPAPGAPPGPREPQRLLVPRRPPGGARARASSQPPSPASRAPRPKPAGEGGSGLPVSVSLAPTPTPTSASPGEIFSQRKISNTCKNRPNGITKS